MISKNKGRPNLTPIYLKQLGTGILRRIMLQVMKMHELFFQQVRCHECPFPGLLVLSILWICSVDLS